MDDPRISHPVIIFDGECVLCNRLAAHILAWDTSGVFKLASGGSETGARLLEVRGLANVQRQTVVVIDSERVYLKSEAVIFVLRKLGKWPVLTTIAGWIPHSLWDLMYDFVARNRYRMFGTTGECQLLPPELRSRLLP